MQKNVITTEPKYLLKLYMGTNSKKYDCFCDIPEDEIKIVENLIEYHREEGNRDALIKVRNERGRLLRLQPMLKSVESQRRKIRQRIKLIEKSKLTEEKQKDRIKKLLDRESVIIQRFIKRADQILG